MKTGFNLLLWTTHVTEAHFALFDKLKTDGRPLIDRFKKLAPAREPVSIQRWSPRRAALTAAVGTGVLVLAGMLVDSVRAGLT